MVRDDRCAKFCGDQILGILENLKLRGEVSPGFRVEVKAVKRLAFVPPGAWILRCPLHRRSFLVRPVPDSA